MFLYNVKLKKNSVKLFQCNYLKRLESVSIKHLLGFSLFSFFRSGTLPLNTKTTHGDKDIMCKICRSDICYAKLKNRPALHLQQIACRGKCV